MFAKKGIYVVSGLVAFAVGLTLVDASPVRASNMDDGFLKGGTAAKIRNYLQKQGHKNVGVLRFEVKEGNATPSMKVGKLNSLVATRLENALIHVNDLENQIGITRCAGATAAAKDKKANWHSAAGRKKLFEYKYPRAWDDAPMQVDAFLTGTVEVSPDYQDAKITVKIFDKKDLNLREVMPAFVVKTDRDTLREMGHSFVLSKRNLKVLSRDGTLTDTELDGEAAQDIATDKTGGGAGNLDQVREFLDFQIVVDNVPSVITPEADFGVIQTPTPDQTVSIKVTAKEKLGLLLKVNGINTLNEERDVLDRQEASWWVLDAGKEYTIAGFYKDGVLKPFKVVAEAEVESSELSDDIDRRGTISFDVFKMSGVVATASEPRIVSRKTSNLLKVVPTKGSSLKNMQDNIRSTMNKLGRRNVYIVGRGEQAQALESEAFQGVFVAGCDIRYRPK